MAQINYYQTPPPVPPGPPQYQPATYQQVVKYPANTYQPHRQMSDLLFENVWTHGACDCCSDCKTCCYAYFCMPCFLCSFDSQSRECPCTILGIMWLLGGNVGICMQRAKLRGAYKISGSIVGDYFFTGCCPFCSLLQMYNEMRYRGDAK